MKLYFILPFYLCVAATASSSGIRGRRAWRASPSLPLDQEPYPVSIHEGKFASTSVGAIGGVGPKSTAEWYEFVNELQQQVGKHAYGTEERPLLLVYNLPLDVDKEEDFIKDGSNKDMYIEEMIRGAKVLMEAQVSMAVIPCNTIHQFLDDVEKALVQHHADNPNIPLLEFKSILDTTLELTDRVGGEKKVLLLGTGETIRQNLYNRKFLEAGYEVYVPASNDTEAGVIRNITKAIYVPAYGEDSECYELLPQECQNFYETKQKGGLLDVGATPAQKELAYETAFAPVFEVAHDMGIRKVVLVCTDFQLVVSEYSKLFDDNTTLGGLGWSVIDSLDSLVLWSANYTCAGKCTVSDLEKWDAHMKCKRNAAGNVAAQCEKPW